MVVVVVTVFFYYFEIYIHLVLYSGTGTQVGELVVVNAEVFFISFLIIFMKTFRK